MATELEIAWAAGLYEGEGTVCWNKSSNQPVIALCMCDEEPVVRFGQVVAPNIKIRRQKIVYKGKTHKDQYVFYCRNQRVILSTYDLFKAWLSPRRRAQYESIIARIESKPAQKRRESRYGLTTVRSMMTDHQSGMTQVEIGKRYGCAQSTVCAMLKISS